MKKHVLSLIFSLLILGLSAQEVVQVSVGNSYSQQAYYSFTNDQINVLDNESWDIAFTTGLTDAGILYNESAITSMSGAVPTLRLYLAPTEVFADVIAPTELFDSLYNSEISWQDGAFNSFRDTANPFDFGWGVYEDRMVQSEYVFAIKLRDDSWKKIEIMSLAKGIYTFRYADLDGSNEVTRTIDKKEYRDKNSPLALFSFKTEKFEAAPTNWDILFGRYVEAITPVGSDEATQYAVTGALTAAGAEVVEARDIDPEVVTIDTYVDSFKTEINVIGQDWKYFDLGGFMWVLDDSRAYFVKLADNHLWKLVFIEFEGSRTGIIRFEKTDLGIFTAVNDPASIFSSLLAFPNPVESQFSFSFSLVEKTANLEIFLINNAGQKVWSTFTYGNKGLNVLNIQTPNLTSGNYQLVCGSGNDFQSMSIFIN